jgi:hypothetical protein
MTIPAGAHIKAWRGAYWHHAIHVGGGVVIHYTGLTKDKNTATIRLDHFETFKAGCLVHIVQYARSFPPSTIVQRARSRLAENGYNLFGNNCEHFARWCVTGQNVSEQANNAAAGGVGVGAGSAATAGSVGAVLAVGEAAGLAGGASIVRGLAAVGSGVGAGAAGGLVVLTAAPAVVANAAIRKAFVDDVMLPASERAARKAARDTTAVTSVFGTVGSVALVSAVGVPGLSAAGITTGLAAIGSALGGGMLAGVAAVVAGPALLAGVLGVLAYRMRKA